MAVVPEVHEIASAIRHLKSAKAPGPDGLPPEEFKAALVPLSHKLHPLFATIWQQGKVACGLKDAVRR